MSPHFGIELFLLFACFGAAAEGPAPPPLLGTLVDAGGYRVHLYCTGVGNPTVIVVGGFSFDWGLVQPEVAKFTRICTWDPSGTAWSDPSPNAPTCADRVSEVHRALKSAGVSGRFVLVGFSIGALWGRLYAHNYPEEVAGLVLVDHAFIPSNSDAPSPKPVSPAFGALDSPPILISAEPITLGIEDDQNFRKLTQRNQDLHAWAMSKNPARPGAETVSECSTALEHATLADKPLVVIRTNNETPGYEELQAKLLALSRNSSQIVAGHSSHMVIVDEPQIIVSSVRKMVDSLRSGR